MKKRKWQIAGTGLAVVDYGPVNMTVQAWSSNGKPLSVACEAGAFTAVSLLDELSRHLGTARLPMSELNGKKQDVDLLPEVLKQMIESVSLLGEDDFTPMAAVAGTFSDLVKKEAINAGADRVMVNNGGDISFSNGRSNTSFKIGIVSDMGVNRPTHTLLSTQKRLDNFGGIATSGIGGRSLTKGVASAVTCFAKTCSLADAAATSIANATDCDHPAVDKVPAVRADGLTDLKDALVTRSVGTLPENARKSALEKGMAKAGDLIKKKMISGCFISVQGLWAMSPEHIVKQLTPQKRD